MIIALSCLNLFSNLNFLQGIVAGSRPIRRGERHSHAVALPIFVLS